MLAQSLASVYHKLLDLVDDVEWLKASTIRERLAKFLLDQMKDTGDGREIALPFSKSLIAAKIGTSPQQLSRTFTKLQEFGVQTQGQCAIIKDADMLREMIEKA